MDKHIISILLQEVHVLVQGCTASFISDAVLTI